MTWLTYREVEGDGGAVTGETASEPGTAVRGCVSKSVSVETMDNFLKGAQRFNISKYDTTG